MARENKVETNMSFLLPFDAKTFVKMQTAEVKRALGDQRAMIACSGGVDSTTCAVLTHRAIGENLVCVFIDTGFMRLDEPKGVVRIISSPPLNLPIKLVDAKGFFMDALRGLEDAEEKRKAFREAFYTTLSKTAREEGCRFLVQGTIAPDWIETKGGIKTQHNVLWQIGINSVKKYGFQVLEPLALLYKDQVRAVARHLSVPSTISERQPFPGPGLSIRVVGKITQGILKILKKATVVVEEELKESRSEQFFAVVLRDEVEGHPAIETMKNETASFLRVPRGRVGVKVYKSRATGVKGDERAYGRIAAISVRTEKDEVYKPPFKDLITLQVGLVSKNVGFTHILYEIAEKTRKAKHIIVVRAIKTRDFMTAQPTSINPTTLSRVAQKILDTCPDVSSIHYDITPKPPATIEFE